MPFKALQRIVLVAVLFGLTFWLFRRAAQTQPVQSADTVPTDTCDYTPVPRAIIAGDSYTYYMWQNDIHNNAFNGFSYPEYTALGNGDMETGYSIPGSQAAQWADTVNYPYLNNLIDEINAHPTVDMIYLSLGINDFVVPGRDEGGWYNGMTPEEEEALFAVVRANTLTVIDAIKAVRPDIHILLGGYDYINMFETGAAGKAIWVRLLFPTSYQVNDAMLRLDQRRVTDIVVPEGIAYTQLMGVNQATFGYSGSQGESFPPGAKPLPGQIPPDYLPMPGGDINYPSNIVGMRDLETGDSKDPVHPSPDAFKAQLRMQEGYYFSLFHTETPDITLRSLGDLVDGHVRSDGGRSYSGIAMGDGNSTLSYRGLVTFDLSAIPPGSTISSATLFLRRETGTGPSPFDNTATLGEPMIDVKTGTFGLPEVEASDYDAPADVVNAGCFHGSARDDKNLVRVILSTGGRNALNLGGLTQMRVYFPNNDPDANVVRFYDGDSSPFQPYLEIDFTPPAETLTPTPTPTSTPTPTPTPRPGFWGFLPSVLHDVSSGQAAPER